MRVFIFNDLKPVAQADEATVVCPVVGCQHRVKRQHRPFRQNLEFLCPEHGIYISASTFSYVDKCRNIWKPTDSDCELYHRVVKVKRESRIGYNNSEDAITWSVFRRLEGKGLIAEAMSQLLDVHIHGEPQCIYWSYSTLTNGVYQPLQAARKAFCEREGRSTEPDLMIETDDYLILVEAKVTANNLTTPSSSTVLANYQTGGSMWFQKVFTEGETAQSIAVDGRLYELMRMWLLGTWMAERHLGKRFILVNLVLDGRELDVEERFIPHTESEHGKFIRRTWEEIGKGLPQEDSLRDYFLHKTRGYSNGKLKHMFKME